MMQAAVQSQGQSQPGALPATGVTVSPVPRNDEVPNLNNYVRSKLSKSEVPGFSECARALGECSDRIPSQSCQITNRSQGHGLSMQARDKCRCLCVDLYIHLMIYHASASQVPFHVAPAHPPCSAPPLLYGTLLQRLHSTAATARRPRMSSPRCSAGWHCLEQCPHQFCQRWCL